MKFIPGDGTKFAIQNTFDMQPNLDSAAKLRSEGMVNGMLGSEARHVARIDKRMMDKLIKEAGLRWDDTEAVRDLIDKKLMDGSLSRLRVWEGSY